MEEIMVGDIECLTFCDSDRVIKNVIIKLEKASLKEKKDFARDILLEANTLLLCLNYNPDSRDCLNCHLFSRKYLREYVHLLKSNEVKI